MEFFQSRDEVNAKLLWGSKIVQSNGVTSKKDGKIPLSASLQSKPFRITAIDRCLKA